LLKPDLLGSRYILLLGLFGGVSEAWFSRQQETGTPNTGLKATMLGILVSDPEGQTKGPPSPFFSALVI
jgi:hypothetical protein